MPQSEKGSTKMELYLDHLKKANLLEVSDVKKCLEHLTQCVSIIDEIEPQNLNWRGFDKYTLLQRIDYFETAYKLNSKIDLKEELPKARAEAEELLKENTSDFPVIVADSEVISQKSNFTEVLRAQDVVEGAVEIEKVSVSVEISIVYE